MVGVKFPASFVLSRLNDSNVLIAREWLYWHAVCAQFAALEAIGEGPGTTRGECLNITNSKADFRANYPAYDHVPFAQRKVGAFRGSKRSRATGRGYRSGRVTPPLGGSRSNANGAIW